MPENLKFSEIQKFFQIARGRKTFSFQFFFEVTELERSEILKLFRSVHLKKNGECQAKPSTIAVEQQHEQPRCLVKIQSRKRGSVVQGIMEGCTRMVRRHQRSA